MKRHVFLGTVALASLVTIGIAAHGQTPAPKQTYPQGQTMPWGQTSDQIAWQTFAQIVAPSGAPGIKAAEFETWASDQDIYQATPVWPSLGTPKRLQTSRLAKASLVHGVANAPMALTVAPDGCSAPGGMGQGGAGVGSGFPANGCVGEEVRRNWASYQYIVRNNLYTKAGLAKAYANPGFTVSLPTDSVEFKGDWVPVSVLKQWLNLTDVQVYQNYYTNTVKSGGTVTPYALVAFHFSTKQQSDWVWSDFEHEGNPGRCDTIGCHDSYGAAVANVQPNATAWKSYGGCAKTPQVAALLKSAGLSAVWSHYCLKGSQVTFTQAGSSTPVLLGNSVIEAITADVPIAASSCQSCHGTAAFDKNGNPNVGQLGTNPVGNVTLAPGFKSADFIWGILLAPGQSTQAKPRSRR